MAENRREADHRIEIIEAAVKGNSELVQTLHTVMMGPAPNRSNGINGNLKKLREDFDKAMDWSHDIWNNKRRTECIQLSAVKDIRDEIDTIRKEMDSMATAKINLKGVYMMGFLQFLGLIGVALIGLMK